MKRNNRYLVVTMLASISAGLILSGCGKKEGAVQDAAAIEESETETAAEQGNAKELDAANLPEDLQNMVHLMDSLNISFPGYEKHFEKATAEDVWGSILIAAVNSDWELYGFEVSEDGMGLCVPAKTAEAMGLAMFGNLTELPEIPESYTGIVGDADIAPVRIDENGDYIMMLGDRGLSESKVERCMDNGDGTFLMEVSLNGVGDDFNEIFSFLYTLRENTHKEKNTLYAYEIIGSEPADQLTSDKIAGIPYLIPYCYYGYQLYEEDSSKYGEVIEVAYFNSLNNDDTTYTSLNDRIQEEIWDVTEKTDESDTEWADVRSYFLTGDDYLQVVSTVNVYPNYATKGDVYSYNYDKKNRRAMTNEDGLKVAGLTENELMEQVAAAYTVKGEGETYDHAQLGGFRVKQDATVDFYLKLFIHNELAEDYDEIAVYQMSDGSLTLYDGEELIDSSQTDVLNPPMTHGIPDSTADK
ncbi:MAG: hypothetical protein QM697_07115 [Lachnospiraceae bacterium]